MAGEDEVKEEAVTKAYVDNTTHNHAVAALPNHHHTFGTATTYPNGALVARHDANGLYYGTTTTNGWVVADGTVGTPDMRGRITINDNYNADLTIDGRSLRALMEEVDVLKAELAEMKKLLQVKSVSEESYDVD